MRPLKIEFQPARPWWKSLVAPAAWMLLSATLYLGFVTYQKFDLYAQAKENLERQEVVVASLQERLLRMQSARTNDARGLTALDMAQFPLDDALAALEGFASKGVQVRMIDVQLQNGTAFAELFAQTPRDVESLLSSVELREGPWRWRVVNVKESASVPLTISSSSPSLQVPLGVVPNALAPQFTQSIGAMISMSFERRSVPRTR